MNEPCTIETGLFKKKPCGQTSVTRCANCEQPLCKAHAVAQKKPGVFMCKECTDAGHQYDKNQAAVAKAEKDKAQAEMLKSMMNPAAPKPKVVSTVADAIASARSWYTYSPNDLALEQAEKQGLKKVCFVGVPCQVTPVRKIQLADPAFLAESPRKKPQHIERQTKFLKAFGEIVDFTVGLLCTEVFTYQGLMVDKIEHEMGIPLADVTKFNVKGKVLIYKHDGELVEMNLKQAQEYARPECHHCGDFSAELADISCGGVGAMDWTIVVLRTPYGEEIFDRAAAGEMPPKEKPRPAPADLEKFLQSLGSTIETTEHALIESRGRAVKRRLNRYEYENTLKDLLDLPTLSVRDVLPEDSMLHGYNRVGEALDISHVQVARYLEAENVRRSRRRLIQAVALQHVRPVHTGRGYLDQHFVFCRLRNGPLDRLQLAVAGYESHHLGRDARHSRGY